MKSAKRKGSRNEHRSMQYLEDLGYICTRAAGSLGLWDIIAVGKYSVQLVQVKTNRRPSRAEMRALRRFRLPWHPPYSGGAVVDKVVHIWRDRTRDPEVFKVEWEDE